MATQYRWYELIERYRPNDNYGRLLIAISSGSFGVYTLIWSVATFMTSGLLLPLVLLLVGLSLGAVSLSIMGFRQIYRSFTGDRETIKSPTQVDTMPSLEERHNDPLAVAKHQYAAGHISEEEFEQRVGNLLDADEKSCSEPRTTSRHNREDTQETS